MDRGARQATIHGVAKSQTRPNDYHSLTQVYKLTTSIIPSADGPNRVEKVKEELSLFLSWEVHLFQLSDIGFPGSPTFRLQGLL